MASSSLGLALAQSDFGTRLINDVTESQCDAGSMGVGGQLATCSARRLEKRSGCMAGSGRADAVRDGASVDSDAQSTQEIPVRRRIHILPTSASKGTQSAPEKDGLLERCLQPELGKSVTS